MTDHSGSKVRFFAKSIVHKCYWDVVEPKAGWEVPFWWIWLTKKVKIATAKAKSPFFSRRVKKKMERDLRKRGCLHIKFRTWNLKGYVVSMDMVYDWGFFIEIQNQLFQSLFFNFQRSNCNFYWLNKYFFFNCSYQNF